jgi:hypothetical protein
MRHHPHHHPHHHHHPPHHHHKIGEETVGKPDDTLKIFLTAPDEFNWMLKKIINEGPPPKQIRNAILLKQMSALVKAVFVLTGKIPQPLAGAEIESDEPEHEDYTYPVQLPDAILTGIKDPQDILGWIAEGPPHDVLRDILLMSAIEWMKLAIGQSKNMNDNEK